MTTLAYRDGVLAGDSRATLDDRGAIVSNNVKKVYRLRDGRLYGFSGVQEDGLVLLDALRKDEKPPADLSVNALLVRPGGSLWLFEGNRWTRQHLPYYAVGSGAIYALVAMDMGADAVTAVRMGIKRDVYSGGTVRAVTINKRK